MEWIKFTISAHLDIETGLYYRCVAWTKTIKGKKYGDYVLLDIETSPLEAMNFTYQVLSEQAILIEEEINGMD